MARWVRGFSLFFALQAFLACPADPRALEAPDLVAVVGENTIDRLTLLKELTWAGVARHEDVVTREAQSHEVLERLIKDELLLQLAAEDGLTVSEDDLGRAMARAAEGYPRGTFERMIHAEQMTAASYRTRLQRQLIIEALLNARMKQSRLVSEAETRARYDQQVLAKPRPPQVRARQVLVKTEEEAEHIIGELEAKRLTVEQAARRYSAAPEGEDGGLLPWFAKGELPKVFDHCFLLEDGGTSGVVPSNYGFHVFELVAKRPGGPPSYEAERGRLQREIRRGKEHTATDALVKSLREKTEVRTDQAAFSAVVEMLPPPPVEEKAAGPDPHLTVPDPSEEAPKFPVRNKPVPRWQPRAAAKNDPGAASPATPAPADPAGEVTP